MKHWDFVIGNPAYQDEVQNKGDRPNPVYDKFLDEAFKISDVVEMITPARFLFNAGQTSKSWNHKMLSDKHLKVLYYTPNAAEVFSGINFEGGVAITLRNAKKQYGPIESFTPFEELNHIKDKVSQTSDKWLDSIVSSRGLYRFTETFFSDFPYAKERLGKGSGNMVVSNIFDLIPEAFSSSKIPDSIQMFGRLENRRVIKHIKAEYIIPNQYLDKYKVMLPEGNGSSSIGKNGPTVVIGEPILCKPFQGGTDTFLSVGLFDTEYEAISLLKYIKTKFCRALVGIKKVTQHNSKSVWVHVPLQDFTSASDIDWSCSITEIDQQLYKKYGLTDEEIQFIETHVKEMN